MSKLYFRFDDEICYPLSSHIQYMKDNQINHMEIFEAKIEHGTGMFFCKHFLAVGELNGTCGKMCEAYVPRNGIKGVCKHHGNVYEKTDKNKVLKIKIVENAIN